MGAPQPTSQESAVKSRFGSETEGIPMGLSSFSILRHWGRQGRETREELRFGGICSTF